MDISLKNAVQIFTGEGGFTVRVVENGDSTDQTYRLEEHARAYAEGQRIRLKLTNYEFVRSDEDA